MKTYHWVAVCCATLSLLLAVVPDGAGAQERKGDNDYRCSEANPETQCNPGTTCGSSSAPCLVNIKRTGYSASATASIPNAKGNAVFWVKTGTTVTWQSNSKNTGFLIDFGPSSPFDPPDTIMGGNKKPVSVKAVKAGCFRYAFQATQSSAIRGMGEASRAELVVVGEH